LFANLKGLQTTPDLRLKQRAVLGLICPLLGKEGSLPGFLILIPEKTIFCFSNNIPFVYYLSLPKPYSKWKSKLHLWEEI